SAPCAISSPAIRPEVGTAIRPDGSALELEPNGLAAVAAVDAPGRGEAVDEHDPAAAHRERLGREEAREGGVVVADLDPHSVVVAQHAHAHGRAGVDDGV